MGQSTSKDERKLTPEEVSFLFCKKCAAQFSEIEIWSIKEVFKQLADHEATVGDYWKEDALLKYLSIPDNIDDGTVGSLIFKSVGFLSAFPFVNTLAPAPLTLQNLIKSIAFYNGKYKGLLKTNYDVTKLLFMSFATYERQATEEPPQPVENNKKERSSEDIVDEDEEDLIMYTLEDIESWDDFEVIQKMESIDMGQYSINGKDLCNLVTLLLLFTNYKPNESVDLYLQSHTKYMDRYRENALSVVRTINPAITASTMGDHKITYPQFKNSTIILPYLFKPLGNLFNQFLYNNKGKKDSSALTENLKSNLLRPADLAQLATILGPEQVYGKFVMLYNGSKSGFSMRSFESKVFKWNAPTLLIVSGSILSPKDHSSRKKAFDHLLPPTRLLKSQENKQHHHGGLYKPGTHVAFAAIIDEPWKLSNKEAFGEEACMLLQLCPMLDVYNSSRIKHNFAYFCNVSPGGIGFGSPPPKTLGSHTTFSLDNVSLTLEESLEYGVFRHLGAGGSYHQSKVHPSAEYEARFSITGLEVWGYGGKDDLEEQKKQWAWEQREAEYRQSVNIGNYDDNWALLEMAGLVGNHGASGGSV